MGKGASTSAGTCGAEGVGGGQGGAGAPQAPPVVRHLAQQRHQTARHKQLGAREGRAGEQGGLESAGQRGLGCKTSKQAVVGQ